MTDVIIGEQAATTAAAKNFATDYAHTDIHIHFHSEVALSIQDYQGNWDADSIDITKPWKIGIDLWVSGVGRSCFCGYICNYVGFESVGPGREFDLSLLVPGLPEYTEYYPCPEDVIDNHYPWGYFSHYRGHYYWELYVDPNVVPVEACGRPYRVAGSLSLHNTCKTDGGDGYEPVGTLGSPEYGALNFYRGKADQ